MGEEAEAQRGAFSATLGGESSELQTSQEHPSGQRLACHLALL